MIMKAYDIIPDFNVIICLVLQGHGSIQLPVEAKPGVLPSMYTGHPSYAYPQGRDYATDRGYPGNPELDIMPQGPYPTGAPPMGQHQGGPAPTGFPDLCN